MAKTSKKDPNRRYHDIMTNRPWFSESTTSCQNSWPYILDFSPFKYRFCVEYLPPHCAKHAWIRDRIQPVFSLNTGEYGKNTNIEYGSRMTRIWTTLNTGLRIFRIQNTGNPYAHTENTRPVFRIRETRMRIRKIRRPVFRIRETRIQNTGDPYAHKENMETRIQYPYSGWILVEYVEPVFRIRKTRMRIRVIRGFVFIVVQILVFKYPYSSCIQA